MEKQLKDKVLTSGVGVTYVSNTGLVLRSTQKILNVVIKLKKILMFSDSVVQIIKYFGTFPSP